VKLVPRLSLVLVGTMSVVLVVRAAMGVCEDNAFFEKDIQNDHSVTAHVLRGNVAEVWEIQGPERAKHLLETANRGSPTLRFRWVPVGAANTVRCSSTSPCCCERFGVRSRRRSTAPCRACRDPMGKNQPGSTANGTGN
jgi:hypothetical protein